VVHQYLLLAVSVVIGKNEDTLCIGFRWVGGLQMAILVDINVWMFYIFPCVGTQMRLAVKASDRIGTLPKKAHFLGKVL